MALKIPNWLYYFNELSTLPGLWCINADDCGWLISSCRVVVEGGCRCLRLMEQTLVRTEMHLVEGKLRKVSQCYATVANDGMKIVCTNLLRIMVGQMHVDKMSKSNG